MKIGIQTRPWGPEMNRERLPDVLAEVAQAGYDGIEIGAQHLDIARPTHYRRLFAEHGLQVVGVHVGGEIHDAASVQEALDNLERIIAFAAQVGATFLPFSGRPGAGDEESLRWAAENLERVGRLCASAGLRLCYHNHFWEIADDCRELRYICAHTDAAHVSLCLDVAWVRRAGGDPAATVRTFLDRIGYLHLKDTTDEGWAELGAGSVDLQGVLQAIGGRPFPWLVVEQDETGRTPLESARISRQYLRERGL